VPIAIALAASGLIGYAALDGWGPALKMFGPRALHTGERRTRCRSFRCSS
jgi:hypothetical protein